MSDIRRILIALVLVSLLVTAGCIGGLGGSDGGTDTNTSDEVAYTGGMDGVEERQTQREFNVTERDGGNTTVVMRQHEEGIVTHLIRWNQSDIVSMYEGSGREVIRTPFDATELDEAYHVYAPEWYDAARE